MYGASQITAQQDTDRSGLKYWADITADNWIGSADAKFSTGLLLLPSPFHFKTNSPDLEIKIDQKVKLLLKATIFGFN